MRSCAGKLCYNLFMQHQRVLIVEDQRDIARMMHSAIQLMDPSLEVVDALSAEEASLELIERGADLLIVDVRLPGISGLELLERWRKQNINVPVIITTGFAEAATREKAQSLGVKAFFAKPLPMDDFLNAVRSILAGKEFHPGEDRTAKVVTDLRKKTNADAVWLCQESGLVALRAGDLLDINESEVETVLQAMGVIQRRASIFLGDPKMDSPSVYMVKGEKRTMVVSPIPNGASLVLLFSKAVATEQLCGTIGDSVRRLEDIYRATGPTAEGGIIPMPAWVQDAFGGEKPPETGPLNMPKKPVEPEEAKSFWEDADLEGSGFLMPGKLNFAEAERLGLAPGEKACDPYRILD
jgi:two-component system, response regulator, stage 0 sporulation protein F